MTFSLPTPIPPRPSSNLEHWIWLDPRQTLDRSPIAGDPQASTLDAALKDTRLVELDIADEACRHHIVERNLGQDPGPCILARLAGAILDPDTVQRRLNVFLWNVRLHGWHCRTIAMDPDAGMLCLIPRPDTIQPGLARAASANRWWPRFHSLTLSVFPSGFRNGKRLALPRQNHTLH